MRPMKLRDLPVAWAAPLLALCLLCDGPMRLKAQQAAPPASAEPQLVILDTDIGDDIDDAFALALVLKSPELKLLGVTTEFGDTELRARLVNRYLQAVGWRYIPVAAGVPTKTSNVFTQRAYAERKGGGVEPADACSERLLSVNEAPILKREQELYDECERECHDAVGFILRNAEERPGQVTLICIGPLFNVQEAIARDAATFRKLKRVVLMGGSVYRGYDGPDGAERPPEPEWNILNDPAGARALLASGAPIYMMPLDSTQIRLDQPAQARVFSNGSALTDQLTMLYHEWSGTGPWKAPTLYDPVAVTYAIRPELCPVTPMRLEVDEKGDTRPTEGVPNVEVCLHSDKQGFLEFLLGRILD